jgi:hypothetical protein
MTDTEILDFLVENRAYVTPVVGLKGKIEFWAAAYKTVLPDGQNIAETQNWVKSRTLRGAVKKLSKKKRV